MYHQPVSQFSYAAFILRGVLYGKFVSKRRIILCLRVFWNAPLQGSSGRRKNKNNRNRAPTKNLEHHGNQHNSGGIDADTGWAAGRAKFVAAHSESRKLCFTPTVHTNAAIWALLHTFDNY